MRGRKLITGFLTMLMVLPMFLAMGGMKEVMAATNPGDQTVTIHKRAFDSLVDEEGNPISIENTGDVMDFGGKGLNGAQFTAYDVSKAYWTEYDRVGADPTLTDEEKTDAKKAAAAEAFVLDKDFSIAGLTSYVFEDTKTVVVDESTNKTEDGVSIKDLPKKSNVGTTTDPINRNAIYLFKETKSPAGVVQSKSVPFVLGLPIYDTVTDPDTKEVTDTDTEKKVVHVYPKNETETVTFEFTKHGVDGNGSLVAGGLTGAIFVLKDSGAAIDGNVYYNTTTGKFDLSKAAAIAQDNPITSGAKGLVSVSGLTLPEGSYEFYEVNSDVSTIVEQDPTKDLYHYVDANNPVVTAHVDTDMVVTYDYYTKDLVKLTGEDTAAAYNYKVPTPTKTVNDKDVDISQELEYEITLKLTDDVKTYAHFWLVDNYGDNLELLSDKDEILAQIPTDIVSEFVSEENKFTLKFIPSKLTPGSTISFKVRMAVKPGAPLDTAINNKITFDNPYDDNFAEVDVETFGRTFEKIDADTKNPLTGATFYVLRDGEYLSIDETTKEYSWVTDETKAHVFPLTDKGELVIAGLAKTDADTNEDIVYELKEIGAPKGYVLPTGTFKFTVGGGDLEVFKVPNKHKGSLPSTGGSGIVAFVLIGVVAVGGAALYFTKGRREIEG